MSPRSSAPRRTLARSLWAAAALIAVAWISHPWWLAAGASRYLSGTSGRAVHVDTIAIGLTASLEPVLRLAGVAIENAPWADSKRPFATAREVVAVVSWRSIAERRPVLSLVVLRDGDVDLERQADGLRNWRLREPENRDPGRYKVLSLAAERSRLRVRHDGIALDVEISASPAGAEEAPAGSGAPLVSRLDVKGALRGVPFEGRVVTGALLTFYETGRTFALRGSAHAGGVRLDAEGEAGDIFRAPRIDAQATLSGKSLVAWRPLVGPHYAAARAFRLQGHVTAADRRYEIAEAKGRIGATDLAGAAGFAHGSGRTSLHADLKSGAGDLDDLLWLAGREPHAGRGRHRRWPGIAEAVRAGRAARGRCRSGLGVAAPALRAVAVPAVAGPEGGAARRRARVFDLDLGYADGHATGRMAFDAGRKPPAAELELDLHGVRLEDLIAAAGGAPRLTGALRGRARLAGTGDSGAALLASARGTASATLAGGTVSSLLDAEMGLEGGKIVRSLISGDEALALPCAAIVLDVAAARQDPRLVVDSANTLTTGTGTIDLRDASDRHRADADAQARGPVRARPLDPPARAAAPPVARAGRASTGLVRERVRAPLGGRAGGDVGACRRSQRRISVLLPNRLSIRSTASSAVCCGRPAPG